VTWAPTREDELGISQNGLFKNQKGNERNVSNIDNNKKYYFPISKNVLAWLKCKFLNNFSGPQPNENGCNP
jgi:hypothetical protein